MNFVYLCVAVMKSENVILVKNSLPSAFLLESALLCITINEIYNYTASSYSFKVTNAAVV